MVILETALPKQERVLSEGHHDTLHTMLDLAITQITLRRFDDAQQLASRGLLLAEKVGNEEYASEFGEILAGPSTQPNNLEQLKADALAFERGNKYQKAFDKYEEWDAIHQRTRMLDHLKYTSMDNGEVADTATSLAKEGRLKESESLARQSYERMKENLGEDHPYTLAEAGNVALSLMDQQRFEEAF